MTAKSNTKASTASVDDKLEKFTTLLRQEGMRMTPERNEILKQIMSLSGTFAINDISKELETNGFFVSKSTIYNTVSLLVGLDVLRTVHINSRSALYEKNELRNYIHLKCEVCGKLKVQRDNNFYAYMKARKFQAFSTTHYELTVYGICNDCARRSKRKTKTR